MDTENGPGSLVDCDLRIEPYGPGCRYDHLVRILPNGIPLFEKSIYDKSASVDGGPSDADTITDIGFTDDARLYDLQSRAQKLFLVINDKAIKKQREKDLITKNRDCWLGLEAAKHKSIDELGQLRTLFDLITTPLPSSVDRKLTSDDTPTGGTAGSAKSLTENSQVALHNAIRERSQRMQCEDLILAVMAKNESIDLLQSNLTKFRDSLHQVVEEQLEFLRVANDLRPWWKLQKIPYAPHVLSCENDSDYPYRAELLLELCSLPSSFMELPVSSPVFGCPPIPPLPPFTPVYVELYLTKTVEDRDKTTDDDTLIDSRSDRIEATGNPDITSDVQTIHPNVCKLSAFLKFNGDVAYYVESRSHLRVQLQLMRVNIGKVFRNSQLFKKLSQLVPVSPPQWPSYVPNTTLPPPINESTIRNSTAKSLHKELQIATWIIVDRAIHALLAHQASLLKCEEESSRPSYNILVGETFTTAAAVNNPTSHHLNSDVPETVNSRAEESCSINKDYACDSSNQFVFFGMKLSVVNWCSGEINLVIEDLPFLFFPKNSNSSVGNDVASLQDGHSQVTSTSNVDKCSINEIMQHGYVAAEIDVAISIRYFPADRKNGEESTDKLSDSQTANCIMTEGKQAKEIKPLLQNDAMDKKDAENIFAEWLLCHLAKLEKLAVCKFRQNFTSVWKYASSNLPAACCDIFPKCTILPAEFCPGSSNFLKDFINWIFQSLSCDFIRELQSEIG